MKQSITTVTCAAALVASLAACGGGGDGKATPPIDTAGPARSTSATGGVTTPPSPAVLGGQSTYSYGGLKVLVNLTAGIPNGARPNAIRFSTFLQSVGRTMARNKLDAVVPAIATPDVVKSVQSLIGKGSDQGIGSVTFKVREVKTTGKSGQALITGCLDQSKLVQVRPNGSRFVDANVKKHPALKMTATTDRVTIGLKVTRLAFVDGAC